MVVDRYKLNAYNKTLIFILCACSVVFLSFNDGLSTKFLHVAGALSVIYFLIMPKKDFLKSPALPVFIALCLFAILNLIWYMTFKTSGTVYSNAYRGPMETGKIALLSAFIFIALLSKDQVDFLIPARKIIFFAVLASSTLLFIFAMWQRYYLHLDRIVLSTSHATTAGYVIMSSAMFSLLVIIKSHFRFKIFLFALIVAISFLTLVATGTRSVILIFLVSTLLLIITDSISNKNFNFKLCLFFLLAAVICILAFKNTLIQRAQEASYDLTHYENNDSQTSIGARLAMYELGLRSYNNWGQSIENRAEKINKIESINPRLSGALPYIDSHLHNDLIETLSTRGIPGVITLLLIYLSLAYYAVMKAKKPCVLVMLLAIFTEGMSDVIFFSKSVPTSVFICFVLLFVFLKETTRISPNAPAA